MFKFPYRYISLSYCILHIFAAPLQVNADTDSSAFAPQGDDLISQVETMRNELPQSSLERMTDGESLIEDEIEQTEVIEEAIGPSFTLTNIQLDGHFVFSGLDLSIYTDKYLNRKIYFSDLKKLSREITEHYRSRGYVTSRAYVPPQSIENQTAMIRIQEGLPGELIVDGNRFFEKSYYQNTFSLNPNRPLNSTDLEKSLKKINQNKHIHSKLYLLAGATPGTTDLMLKTEESNPMSVYYRLHNKGSSSTHHSRHAFHFDHDSFFGVGDSLNTAYILSEEGSIMGGYGFYALPTRNPNLSFRISGSYFKSMLTNHFKATEIKGVSTTITTGLTYNLWQSQNSLLQFDAGFEVKDSKTAVNDFKINMDRMRVITIGPRFLTNFHGLQLYTSQDTHIGIPGILGGSQENDLNTTQVNTGGRFIYYTGQVTAIKKFSRHQTLKISSGGQWSKDNLTSLERYRIGGSRSVRAYPESDSGGDYGYTTTFEYRGPLPGIDTNKKSSLSKKSMGSTYQWSGFFDIGKAFNRERAQQASVKDKLLMGAGLGLYIDLGKWLEAEMTYAFPFGDTSTDKDRNQFFFSVKSGF